MGNAVSILKDCSQLGNTCSKYVCNSMTFHSDCCEYCQIDCQTNEIEVSNDDSELELKLTYHKTIIICFHK